MTEFQKKFLDESLGEALEIRFEKFLDDSLEVLLGEIL